MPADTFSLREKDHNYQFVVAILEPKLRLIECVTDLQWIVQLLSGDQWRSYWHCRTEAGLQIKYRFPAIEALPDRYLPRSQRAATPEGPREPSTPSSILIKPDQPDPSA